MTILRSTGPVISTRRSWSACGTGSTLQSPSRTACVSGRKSGSSPSRSRSARAARAARSSSRRAPNSRCRSVRKATASGVRTAAGSVTSAIVKAVRLPGGLDWWRSQPGGAAWLDRLPRLAAECAEAWELELGDAFAGAHASLALRATRADGTPAVLKLNFPDRETEHEADALAWWDGDGAARLLERDDERAALLVERCDPGTQLWALPEHEALPIAAGLLRRLRRHAPADGPIHPLREEAERWAEELPRRWTRPRPAVRAAAPRRGRLGAPGAGLLAVGGGRPPPGLPRRQHPALRPGLAGDRPEAARRRPGLRCGLAAP